MKVLINVGTNPSGGGAVHIIELLKNFNYLDSKIKTIVLLAPKLFLDKVEDKPYIVKKSNIFLNGNSLFRLLWRYIFVHLYIEKNTDLIYSPFGDFYNKKYLCLTMSQNMLFFENHETINFPILYRIKFFFMGKFQLYVFNNSKHVIFLSKYAKDFILKEKIKLIDYKIIHHGISNVFNFKPKIQKDYTTYNLNNKFKLLFVSSIFPYKNMDILIQSFKKIIIDLPNVELIIIGEIPIKKDKKKYLKIFSSKELKDNLIYKGHIQHNDLPFYYHTSDMFIFSSTCENMPNILIEAMSSGLPIMCSNKDPMKEFIQNGAIYFDAKNVEDTVNALRNSIINTNLRSQKSLLSYKYSQNYSWEKCSQQTFKYIEDLIIKNKIYA